MSGPTPAPPLSPLSGGTRSIGPFKATAQIALGRRTTAFLAHQDDPETLLVVRQVRAEVDQEVFEAEARGARVFEGQNSPELMRTSSGLLSYGPAVIGESLSVILDRALADKRPLDLDVSLAIAMGIASKLARSGEKRFHGDLVPHHVLIGYDGTIHLIDAACAAYRERMKAPSRGGYRSPEHVKAEVLAPASDIFVLGILLFEMTTATRLFNAATPRDIDAAILEARLPRPRDLVGDGYPIELQLVLRKLLRPAQAGRFPDGASARDALRLVAGARAELTPAQLGNWLRTAMADRWSSWRMLLSPRSIAAIEDPSTAPKPRSGSRAPSSMYIPADPTEPLVRAVPARPPIPSPDTARTIEASFGAILKAPMAEEPTAIDTDQHRALRRSIEDTEIPGSKHRARAAADEDSFGTAAGGSQEPIALYRRASSSVAPAITTDEEATAFQTKLALENIESLDDLPPRKRDSSTRRDLRAIPSRSSSTPPPELLSDPPPAMDATPLPDAEPFPPRDPGRLHPGSGGTPTPLMEVELINGQLIGPGASRLPIDVVQPVGRLASMPRGATPTPVLEMEQLQPPQLDLVGAYDDSVERDPFDDFEPNNVLDQLEGNDPLQRVPAAEEETPEDDAPEWVTDGEVEFLSDSDPGAAEVRSEPWRADEGPERVPDYLIPENEEPRLDPETPRIERAEPGMMLGDRGVTEIGARGDRGATEVGPWRGERGPSEVGRSASEAGAWRSDRGTTEAGHSRSERDIGAGRGERDIGAGRGERGPSEARGERASSGVLRADRGSRAPSSARAPNDVAADLLLPEPTPAPSLRAPLEVLTHDLVGGRAEFDDAPLTARANAPISAPLDDVNDTIDDGDRAEEALPSALVAQVLAEAEVPSDAARPDALADDDDEQTQDERRDIDTTTQDGGYSSRKPATRRDDTPPLQLSNSSKAAPPRSDTEPMSAAAQARMQALARSHVPIPPGAQPQNQRARLTIPAGGTIPSAARPNLVMSRPSEESSALWSQPKQLDGAAESLVPTEVTRDRIERQNERTPQARVPTLVVRERVVPNDPASVQLEALRESARESAREPAREHAREPAKETHRDHRETSKRETPREGLKTRGERSDRSERAKLQTPRDGVRVREPIIPQEDTSSSLVIPIPDDELDRAARKKKLTMVFAVAGLSVTAVATIVVLAVLMFRSDEISLTPPPLIVDPPQQTRALAQPEQRPDQQPEQRPGERPLENAAAQPSENAAAQPSEDPAEKRAAEDPPTIEPAPELAGGPPGTATATATETAAEAEKGRKPIEAAVRPAPSPDRETPKAVTTRVQIRARPRGVRILADGKEIENGAFIEVGEDTVEIVATMPGYKDVNISVQPGTTKPIDLLLRRQQREP